MCYSLVECFGLFEVDDIEAHPSLTAVLNCKIKPLQMTAGVSVDAQIEVVFCFAHLHHAIQVAAFKVAVEDEFTTGGNGGVHALEYSGIFGFEVGMELAKVCCHVGIIRVEGALVLEGITTRHLLVQFKTAGKPPP